VKNRQSHQLWTLVMATFCYKLKQCTYFLIAIHSNLDATYCYWSNKSREKSRIYVKGRIGLDFEGLNYVV
jgi:hypothetical protein